MQIAIKGQGRIADLDERLSAMLPACVEATYVDGRDVHQAAPDGTYTVRILDACDSNVRWAKELIALLGFEVVSEQKHD